MIDTIAMDIAINIYEFPESEANAMILITKIAIVTIIDARNITNHR